MQYIDILTRKDVVSTCLITSLMLVIFVADLQVTTEIYIGGLYIVIIMLSLWLPNTRYTMFFAIFSTVLTSFGFFNSIYNISIRHYFTTNDFINLSMTISAIWITTLIAIYIRNVNMELTKSETLHKAILNASIDPIIIIDTKGNIESSSRAAEKTFGWSIAELNGKPFNQLLSINFKEIYADLFTSETASVTSKLIGNVREIVAKHRMKREFPCELSINYIDIPELDRPFFTAVLRDITLRKITEQRMDWLSFHDELTKIYNRRYLNEQFEKEWKRLLRSKEHLAMIMIDVDFFKNYNDSLGHQVGDNCLSMIASSLEIAMRRSTDFVARYGGEEFVVLLPATDLAGAELVAANLLTSIRNLSIPHPTSKASKKVSVSMGVAAMVPTMGCSYERLIRFADQALYKAKETGRNKFCSYTD